MAIDFRAKVRPVLHRGAHEESVAQSEAS
jgi:hypothetical protein